MNTLRSHIFRLFLGMAFMVILIDQGSAGTLVNKQRSFLQTRNIKPNPPQYKISLFNSPSAPHIYDIFRLNNAGFSVGYAGSAHAWMWDRKGNAVFLGTLGGNVSFAYGLNESGMIVGGSEIDLSGSGIYHAFFKKNFESEMIDLGTLGGDSSVAWGINSEGLIVGNSDTPYGTRQAFLWKDDKMIDLGTAFGKLFSVATDINNKGQIVGYAEDGYMFYPLIWNADETMSVLSTPQDCLIGGMLHTINDNGEIGGGCYVLKDSRFYYAAIIWDQKGVPRFINLVSDDTVITGINNQSQFVGVYGGLNPFVSISNRIWDINVLISPVPGLRIISASDINDFSEITGLAIYHDQPYGVLLTPK